MGINRDGQDPSGYLGLVPTQNPYLIVAQRDPTTLDRRYKIGTPWVNKASDRCFQLASAGGGTATWVLLGANSTDLDTLTADSGGAISPVSANIDILGGTNLTTVGTAGTITLNLDAAITLATSVTSPIYTSAGALAINMPAGAFDMTVKLADAAGAQKLSFTDSADAEIASLDSNGNLTALSFATSVATAGLTISGADIDADGSDADISVTVSPKGTGDFVVDVGDIQATAGDIIATRSSASGDVTVEVTNSDNTAADSDAFFEVAVGGTSSGNPGVRFQISGGQNYSMGIDNASASDDLLVCGDNDIGTDPLLRIEELGNVTVEKGNLILGAVATQIQMNGGAVTDFIGAATLSSGTVTVLNTNIAATDRIFLSRQDINGSTTLGMLTYAITASTSFTITAVQTATPASAETGDSSIVEYVIIRQN